MENAEFKNKQGIIVMLDALGTKNMAINEALNFLKIRDKIITVSPDKILLMLMGKLNLLEEKELIIPRLITFGDTMILIWESSTSIELIYGLIGQRLMNLMKVAFQSGILLRGAISYGDFIDDGKNTILGPAINDVVSWYEMANWMGIICTPQYGFMVAKIRETSSRETSSKDLAIPRIPMPNIPKQFCSLCYINYNVPLRDGRTLPLWCISWPLLYIDSKNENGRCSKYLFLNDLNKYLVPLGSEDKYFETINFFDWFNENKLYELITPSTI